MRFRHPPYRMPGGAHGISAINTISSVLGINHKTLKPLPTVEGYTVPGGYSGAAVRPIALRMVMELAKGLPNCSISGMGGVETAKDAAEFILMGSHTVQVCTGAMLQGSEFVAHLSQRCAVEPASGCVHSG